MLIKKPYLQFHLDIFTTKRSNRFQLPCRYFGFDSQHKIPIIKKHFEGLGLRKTHLYYHCFYESVATVDQLHFRYYFNWLLTRYNSLQYQYLQYFF